MLGTSNAVGGAEPFGYIIVGYPAGSTCGLTDWNGTELLAENTSGYYVFPVSYAATYTVACFDGADYDSSANQAYETVTISAQSPYALVELSYQLILIAPTTAAIATGYTLENRSVTTNSTYGNYIKFGEGNTAGVGGYINPAIDLTNYNTLRLKACLSGDAYSSTSYGTIGVYKTLPTYSAPNPVAGIYMGYGYGNDAPHGLSNAEEFTVDISKLSGEYYFSGFNNGWAPVVFWAIFE